ncbi:MAG: CRISPR system precrRNA processing endoribonuclease RAMP protein Cas6 [Chitinophagales bacterium]
MVDFQVACLDFILQPVTPITLPRFREGVWRGKLGSAIRRQACTSKNTDQCANCADLETCAFAWLISPFMLEKVNYTRNGESVPRPITLHFTSPGQSFIPQQPLELRVTLFGQALVYARTVLKSIEYLGQVGIGTEQGEGQYLIKNVYEWLPEDNKKLLFSEDGQNNWIHPQGFSISAIAENVNPEDRTRKCKIYLETPLRIKREGELVENLDFPTLMRGIINRLNAISSCFGENDWLRPNVGFWHLANQVRVAGSITRVVEHRWPAEDEGQTLFVGGVEGTIELRGPVDAFRPFLRAAEIVGIGLNTTFGFGRIRIEPGEPGWGAGYRRW